MSWRKEKTQWFWLKIDMVIVRFSGYVKWFHTWFSWVFVFGFFPENSFPHSFFSSNVTIRSGLLSASRSAKRLSQGMISLKKCQGIHKLDTDHLLSVLGYCEGVKWGPLQASIAKGQEPERLWPCPTFKPYCLVCRGSKATEITTIMLHHAVPINKCVSFHFSFSCALSKVQF